MTAPRFILTALLLACPLAAIAQQPTAPDYNTDIAPILDTYCVSCHGAVEPEGGLNLESHEQLLQGGRRGAAVAPGNSDLSRLILVLDGRAEPAMPPEDYDPPEPEELALLKAWVDAGAKGPTGAAPDPTLLVTPRVELLAPARLPINAAAYSPDGSLMALAGNNSVRLLKAADHSPVRELAGHRGHVNSVAFSADGSKLATACGEAGLFGEARLWNVSDGSLIRTFVGHRDSLFAATLSPDGTILATGGYDEQIKLWDVNTGAELRTLSGHNGAVFELAFRRDGKLLASASGDRTVKLWDVATGARLDTLAQAQKDLYTVAISPDGTRVAAGGVDNRIRVWQISNSGQEGTNTLLDSRFAHQGPILKLAYSPDGALLASASEDRTIKLWDAATLRERHLLETQSDWTTALAFAPDSKSVLVGRLDGSYAVYDAATGQPLTLPSPPIAPQTSAAEDSSVVSSPWSVAGRYFLAPLVLAFLQNEPAAAPPPKPELAGVAPRGVQRGIATKVKLAGSNLVGVTEVRLNNPKLTATLLPEEPDLPGEAWIEVTPAADLPRGKYEIGISTAGGASGNVALHVDSLAQHEEAEPNGVPSTATGGSLPAGYWGTFGTQGDVDCFGFDARAGTTVVLDVEAASLGSKANVVLSVLDGQGRVLASSNDFDGQADPLLAFTPPADGRYTASVSDLALGTSGEHYYRLSIGEFAYVTGCFPLSVPGGQETAVELTGFNLPADAKVKVSPGDSGDVVVPLDPELFRSRRELRVAAGQLPSVLEAEPNDRPDQAATMSAPGVAGGRIWNPPLPPGEGQGEGAALTANSSPDADLFRFESRAGQSWIIETDAARRSSPADTRIEVLDAAGQPVERLLLQAVRDSYITFRGIDSNTNDIRVKNWEEMELNQLMYMQGEVCKIFRMPQGPDSGFNYYLLNGKRLCYFDTSATAHALDEPCYIVEPHPPGTALVPTGLPIFPLHYANDDDGQRKLGGDSQLTFTAPADGAYLVRVTDVRGLSGDRFAYRLIVREPRPDFSVSLGGANPTINAGSGKEITLSAERLDGFDGDIQVEITGLPPGFSVSSPVVIQSGHYQAKAAISAPPDAPQPNESNWSHTQVTATAIINGAAVTKPVNNVGKIALAEKPKVIVRLEAISEGGPPGGEIVIAPGTSVQALLKVERNGFNDRIAFNVENLPHGVIVDDIGLSGVLIPEGQSERRIFLDAAAWVPETTRPFHATATVEGNQSSPPLTLHVRRPDQTTQAANP